MRLEDLKELFPVDWKTTLSRGKVCYYYLSDVGGQGMYLYTEDNVWLLWDAPNNRNDRTKSIEDVKSFYKKHFKLANFK